MWLKRARRALSKVGLYGFLALSLVIALFWWGCTEPSDETLRRRFQRDRSDFQTLIAMSDEDSTMWRIDFGWARPESPGLTQRRWEAYRVLFKKLDIDRGIQRKKSGNVYLLAYSEGMFNRGMSKGYVYCRTKAQDADSDYEPCVEQKTSGWGEHYIYSRIGDGWYIYLHENLTMQAPRGQRP